MGLRAVQVVKKKKDVSNINKNEMLYDFTRFTLFGILFDSNKGLESGIISYAGDFKVQSMGIKDVLKLFLHIASFDVSQLGLRLRGLLQRTWHHAEPIKQF